MQDSSFNPCSSSFEELTQEVALIVVLTEVEHSVYLIIRGNP